MQSIACGMAPFRICTKLTDETETTPRRSDSSVPEVTKFSLSPLDLPEPSDVSQVEDSCGQEVRTAFKPTSAVIPVVTSTNRSRGKRAMLETLLESDD